MNTKNAKWTPGPWIAVANRPQEDARLDRVKAPDGSNVAFIPDHEHDHAQEQANARLIAAAPELAEVLAALLSARERNRTAPDGDALADAIIDEIKGEERARAILARINGGSE